MFNWWTFDSSDDAHDNYLNNFEGIDFAGNKILKKAVANEMAWFAALKACCSAIYDFLKAREGNIWMWSGKDTGDAAAFFAQQLEAGPGAAPAQAAPKEEKKVEEKPKAVVKGPVKKAVKPPTMNENMIKKEWVIENYKEGVVTLNEESYDEDTADRTPGVTYQYTLKIFDCQNTTFIINGKCKNIFIDNCKKCQIQVQSVVTGVELSKCNTVKIQ